ncbi:hypothetical protein FE257_005146 [Aspergillus nanangensis]|uniref:Bicarbonate transporter-like transmembrane domain-containing protein n=1 Tax=Aspergillus nanangensis TaxID=2582783 RepID=A0AAD4CBG8_ASPNN|nr:hypothetical protein FE257_005146 [Aspergillus nanangensis]
MSESFNLTRETSYVSTYRYDNLTGWKRLRPLRLFRGMYHDVRRRLPYYWSDITDAFTYRTAASTIRMYFVNILPAIAYTLDMYRRTGEFYGINEALFSSAMAALIFSVLGAQPLTIVGITGLISLFNYTIYDIIIQYEPVIYPNFMCWTAIWAAIFHWIVAVCNICDYMRYVTDFSSESFGAYVGIIYCIKGVEELVNEFTEYGSTAGFMSCMIAILYFLTIYGLEMLGSSTICRPWFRGLLADYAYVIGTIFWVGFSHIPGPLKAAPISYVPISRAFYPTQPRGWLIHFWELDVKWVFAALPFGFLIMLLFYYDHAPVHTDSLTIYKTELHTIRTEEGEGAEIRRPIVRATAVVEQRVSHFLMGLGIIGTMTGPLLIVLHTMPIAVFAGVFFIVGWGAIESNGILQKFVFLVRENRFIQRDEPLLRVKRKKIVLYIACQVIGVAACVAISQTIAAIGFPILIIALIPFRVWIIPKWFSQEELDVLDDLTANNSSVLASLGGPPKFPGEEKENYGLERKYTEQRRGSYRQRAGNIHR